MARIDVEEFRGVLDYLLKHYEKLESMERRLSQIASSELEATRVKLWKIALGGLISKYKTLIEDLNRGESISVVIDACKIRDEVSRLLSEYSRDEDLIAPVRPALAKIYADALEICGESP
ncbi:MAG: hypothetical protein QXS85_03115 [Acidilobaceae archaeon]